MDRTSKTALMLAKARDKISTAAIDFENGKYDDTVSRAYYAVFHAVSAALSSKGLLYSTHAQTIGAFNREFVKTGIFPRTFSKIVKRLFNERQIGDYDYDSWIDEQTARESIENAGMIVTEIEKYLEDLEHTS
jgi:uncharacterized protein (UPF0332 family)